MILSMGPPHRQVIRSTPREDSREKTGQDNPGVATVEDWLSCKLRPVVGKCAHCFAFLSVFPPHYSLMASLRFHPRSPALSPPSGPPSMTSAWPAVRLGGMGLREVADRYRGRFGIESSYRALGRALSRISSRSPALRLLQVGVGVLL
jgi:hypothetical protein